MSKRLIVALAALFAVALIAAQCGAPTAPEQVTVVVTKEVEKEVVVTQEVEKEVVVTKEVEVPGEMIRLNLAIQGEDRNEMNLYQELVNKFEADHPNIDVNVDWLPWDTYLTKLKTGFAAGNPPDVFWLWINECEYYASADELIDLAPLAEADGFPVDDYFPAAIDAFRCTDGQKLFGIPRETSLITLYYNRDMFDEAGLAYPDENLTFDQYLDYAQKLTKKDADGNVVQFGSASMSDSFDIWSMLWSFGGDAFDETKCVLDSPEAIEALQWMADLSVKYGVAPTAGQAAGMSEEQLFLSGKVAMFLSGRWSTMTLWNAENAPRWDVSPVPALNPETRKVRTSAGAHAVPADSKHPKEAWELVKALSSKEAYEFFTASGVIIPAYIPAAEGDVFLQPGRDPEHADYFLSGMAYARLEPIGTYYPKVTDVLYPGLDPMWSGDKTAAEVVVGLCPKLEAAARGD